MSNKLTNLNSMFSLYEAIGFILLYIGLMPVMFVNDNRHHKG